MTRYKLYANQGGPTYVLGNYRYKWLAWCHGVAHIMAEAGRSTFIDEVEVDI